MKSLPLAVAILALAGCATAPKSLQGEFAMLMPSDASAAQRLGDTVRWGGTIVTVNPAPNETCFEVLGRDLGETARPIRADDSSSGRFLACRAGFYDPAIFAPDREVTVTGRVAGFEPRRIGEYEYLYPRVAADVVYLWPERTIEDYYYYHADPFWPWGGSYWWSGYYVPVHHGHGHGHGRGRSHSAPAPQPTQPPPPASGRQR